MGAVGSCCLSRRDGNGDGNGNGEKTPFFTNDERTLKSLKSGYLERYNPSLRKWERRWFVLASGKLSWYEDEQAHMADFTNTEGFIELSLVKSIQRETESGGRWSISLHVFDRLKGEVVVNKVQGSGPQREYATWHDILFSAWEKAQRDEARLRGKLTY
eukprot:GILK01003966.1.p1 GENE.GILK01003966.1~~GILK01003966.1.p1  ORF type:complete len:182 (-),score=24.46 GILK01003966.1:202-678(-)